MVAYILAQVKKPLPDEFRDHMIPQKSSWIGHSYFRFYVPAQYVRELMKLPASEGVRLGYEEFRKSMGWAPKFFSQWDEFFIGRGFSELELETALAVASGQAYREDDMTFKGGKRKYMPIPDLTPLESEIHEYVVPTEQMDTED